jgi:dolichyl-phosphate beta-glucosyltransferase
LQPGEERSISIIIPILNEKERVRPCIEKLLSYCTSMRWDFELVFVDDGSGDGTTEIVESYNARHPNVKLLNLPKGLGKGGSIARTMLTQNFKECVEFMDVDLSADPSELEKLLPYIEDYDVVVGSRILRDGLQPVRRPFYRSLLSVSYSRLFRLLFRIQIYDPQCGFKVFRNNITRMLFYDIKTVGFAFDTELIVTAFAQGLRIKEVPINWTHGEFSKINILHEVQAMGTDLFSIWYRFHISGLQNKLSYPQKRYSFYGRVLFSILSRIKDEKHMGSHTKKQVNIDKINRTKPTYSFFS